MTVCILNFKATTVFRLVAFMPVTNQKLLGADLAQAMSTILEMKIAPPHTLYSYMASPSRAMEGGPERQKACIYTYN